MFGSTAEESHPWNSIHDAHVVVQVVMVGAIIMTPGSEMVHLQNNTFVAATDWKDDCRKQ